MRLSRLFLSFPVLAWMVVVVVADLQPIEVKGSKFFYKNGTQFFIKGIAYQQEVAAAGATNEKAAGYIDPLANETLCNRDVPFLQELGTNTIRVYAIDPAADHSACMKLLQDAGIYVVADLGEPNQSINRDNPQWNTKHLTRYQKVVDVLYPYSNVIGFFAGKEVTNKENNTFASAYVKAAVRDTKQYIKNKKIARWLGVGYAANDHDGIRNHIASYFNCDSVDDATDFFAYNVYSWCAESDMQRSGYNNYSRLFENYSVPVFFAEYGCNEDKGPAGRISQETEALYSDKMTPVFSGGIVYMYYQEENDFGLVKVHNGKVTTLGDYDALKKQVTNAHPKGVNMDDYRPTGKMAECPELSATWEANKVLPPTPDVHLCDCMVSSRSCVPHPDLSTTKYGDIFGYICGKSPEACVGIHGNATTGVYGAYSMCDDGAKLAYVLDAYFQKLNKAADACDFNGGARVQKATEDQSCASALASASDTNKKAATATGPIGGKTTGTDPSLATYGIPLTRVFSVGNIAVSLNMLISLYMGVVMITL